MSNSVTAIQPNGAGASEVASVVDFSGESTDGNEINFCRSSGPITWCDNGDDSLGAGDLVYERSGYETLNLRLKSSSTPGMLDIWYDDGVTSFKILEESPENIKQGINSVTTFPLYLDGSPKSITQKSAIDYTCELVDGFGGEIVHEDNGDGEVGVGDYYTNNSGRFYLDSSTEEGFVDVMLATGFAGGFVQINGAHHFPIAKIQQYIFGGDSAKCLQ